jgi:hypothetical protein
MVVLAIIVVITSVVLTSQNSFNKTLILANTAYDIALTLRSAQTYGLSSRGRTNAAGAFVSANAGYGLHFQTSPAGSFTLFSDTYPDASASSCHPTSNASAPDAKPGNCSYESAQGEKVVDYKLGNGITVSDFCARSLGSWSCTYAHNGASSGLSSLDIVFARPNPDPFMSVNGSYSAIAPVTAVCVAITSSKGGAHFVSVAASGQIVANAPSCP